MSSKHVYLFAALQRSKKQEDAWLAQARPPRLSKTLKSGEGEEPERTEMRDCSPLSSLISHLSSFISFFCRQVSLLVLLAKYAIKINVIMLLRFVVVVIKQITGRPVMK